jgi:iron complex outermembrane receptor protein
VSARWQPIEWLVLRGSVGSTFRAPPESITAPGRSRFQAQFSNPVDGSQLYRAVDIANDPMLEPEEADTYNVGFVISTDELELFGMNIGAYNLTVDYYVVNFEKELSAEAQGAVYGTMFRTNNPANWQCANDVLRERFTFVSGLGTNAFDYNGAAPGGVFENCHPNNFNAVEIKRLNGASTDIKGVDIAGFWDYADIFGSGGDLQLGVESSYLMSYERSSVSLVGTSIVVEAETDRAGTAELLGSFFSYPEWRTFAFARYRHGDHNVRWTTRYYSGVQDRNAGFRHRRPHTVHDLTYMLTLEDYGVTLTGTVANLFDVEPPFIRSQNNYDYANLSPLGRTFEIGLKWSME